MYADAGGSMDADKLASDLQCNYEAAVRECAWAWRGVCPSTMMSLPTHSTQLQDSQSLDESAMLSCIRDTFAGSFATIAAKEAVAHSTCTAAAAVDLARVCLCTIWTALDVPAAILSWRGEGCGGAGCGGDVLAAGRLG